MTTRTDLLHDAWAMRPELLPMVAAFLRGEVTETQLVADEGVLTEAAEQEAALRRETAGAGIALIPLRGMITPRGSFLSMLFGGGGGLQSFRAGLREALASDEIGQIVIEVDSPGGSVSLVPETAAEVRAARAKKPIVAVVNTMAASAAYWIASQATEVVSTQSGSIGSIGVWTMHEDASKRIEEMGFSLTFISAGKYKVEGNRYEALSDEAREFIQARVDDTHANFLGEVAKGRGVGVGTVRTDFGEGRMLAAKQALDAGMVDRVDTLEGTIARLARGGSSSRRRAEEDTPQPTSDTEDKELLADMKQRLDQTTKSLKED